MSIVNEYALKSLTNELVQAGDIPITSHRGQTVSTVISNIEEECESIKNPMTMKLDNVTNIFSVGQGTNADVSKDVVTGKVEVELKGKTYQNLTSSGVSFNKAYAISYDVEIKEKSTMVTYNGGTVSWKYWCNEFKRTMLKPNTDYTIIAKIRSNFQMNYVMVCIQEGNATLPLAPNVYMKNIRDDIWVAKLTTKSSLDIAKQVLYFAGDCTKFTNKGDCVEFYKDMILLEGDYTQTPIEELPPYFDGIQSAFEDGIVDVEVTGKNLFDKDTHFYPRGLNANGTWYSSDGVQFGIKELPVKPNTQYIISGVGTLDRNIVSFLDENKNFIKLFASQKFTTTNDCRYINVYVGQQSSLISDVQIEEGSKATSYEPYNKKKISFNIGEPLRSLPNGVCDEIRNNNGQWELVRKVGKIVLDGSESWTGNLEIGEFRLVTTPKFPSKATKYLDLDICNLRIGRSAKGVGQNGEIGVSIYPHSSTSSQLIWKEGTTSSLNSITSMKQYLSNNNMVIYYELATPVVTPIEPISFDVKPLSTMYINSLIAPVSTHSVELNRTAQIERTIIEIAELKNRVDALEQAYDSFLLETQYKLSLLGMDYELETEGLNNGFNR